MKTEDYWPKLADGERMIMACEMVKGPNDGRKMALVEWSDGHASWISNLKPGEFKQVWVPVNFEHPELIE